MTPYFQAGGLDARPLLAAACAGLTENDGPKMTTGLNLYSVYSNVRRLCALLCPAISFLHFHVLQFHALQF